MDDVRSVHLLSLWRRSLQVSLRRTRPAAAVLHIWPVGDRFSRRQEVVPLDGRRPSVPFV